MTETELEALLQGEYHAAMGALRATKLSEDRQRALDYYNGDVSDDMPSLDGRSTAVSMDVQETVEGLMPDMMEIFTADDDVISFDPVGPEDEDAAAQETDYVNHVFMQKNPGFLILYTFIKDALLSKTGIVKVYWEQTEKETKETYFQQSDDVFAFASSDPRYEVIEHSEEPDPINPGKMLHDFTISKKKNVGVARVVNIPPEEFGISRWARSIKQANYCYHEVRKTISDLVEQGYDEDEVKELPTAALTENLEEIARDTVEQFQPGGGDIINESQRLVKVVEHYVRCDRDQTGVAKLYKITTGGSQGHILTLNGKKDIEEIDFVPIAAMTPVIMTHRFWGKSVADLVLDIQKQKTALLRGLLDNVYLSNNQRMLVATDLASDDTVDDMLINRPGAIVRGRQPGAVTPLANAPLGDFVFPLIEYIDGSREFRTGTSRVSQGLDPNTLQNTSATASNNLFTAAQAKKKLIARIFAETGIKDLFLLLHAVIRKHDREENTVRLRNKWVRVNPTDWREREDMTPSVGLGTGSTDQKIARLMTLISLQKEANSSPQLGLIEPVNFWNSAKEMIKLLQFKNPEDFFTDPTNKPPQPPPPDPEMVKAQTQAQLEQQKAQTAAQLEQQKAQTNAQLEMAKAQKSGQVEQQQAAAAIETQNAKASTELQLAREKAQLEAQLKLMDHDLKVKQMEMQASHQATAASQQAAASGLKARQKPDGSTEHVSSQDLHNEAMQSTMMHMANALNNLAAAHAAPKKSRVVGPSGKVYTSETI